MCYDCVVCVRQGVDAHYCSKVSKPISQFFFIHLEASITGQVTCHISLGISGSGKRRQKVENRENFATVQ